jgi:hypothetical protein
MAAEESGQNGAKNPPYMDMIVAAINADQSPSGTSQQVKRRGSGGSYSEAFSVIR